MNKAEKDKRLKELRRRIDEVTKKMLDIPEKKNSEQEDKKDTDKKD